MAYFRQRVMDLYFHHRPETTLGSVLRVHSTFSLSFLSLVLLSDALSIYMRDIKRFNGQRASTFIVRLWAGHTYKIQKKFYI